MENMKLELERALKKLGDNMKPIDINLFSEIAAANVNERYEKAGFAKLEHRGNSLYTSTKGENAPKETHVGQMRIHFDYSPCGTASIMAQHMKNDDGEFTFR